MGSLSPLHISLSSSQSRWRLRLLLRKLSSLQGLLLRQCPNNLHLCPKHLKALATLLILTVSPLTACRQTPSPLQTFLWASVALPPRVLLSLKRTNTRPLQSSMTSSNPLLFKSQCSVTLLHHFRSPSLQFHLQQ